MDSYLLSNNLVLRTFGRRAPELHMQFIAENIGIVRGRGSKDGQPLAAG